MRKNSQLEKNKFSGRRRKMYLEVRNLKKSYGENGSYVQVLKGINTEVEKGQMCVI